MSQYDWMRERWPGFVEPTPFEEYSAKFAEFFSMKREGGIIEVAMHTAGGRYQHSWAGHNAWHRLWYEIGADPDNEVLILTGTGDRWFSGPDDPASLYTKPFHEEDPDVLFQMTWDGQRNIENFIQCIDIPTIGVLNGPGVHWQFPLFCDITLAAEDVDFLDPHFLVGNPPGDGMGLALQMLMGVKRSAYHLYTCGPLQGQKAIELGIVNEVLDRDELLPRAWELARMVMERPRFTRRYTHAITARPWRKLLVEDFGFQARHQLTAELGGRGDFMAGDARRIAEERRAW